MKYILNCIRLIRVFSFKFVQKSSAAEKYVLDYPKSSLQEVSLAKSSLFPDRMQLQVIRNNSIDFAYIEIT